ncbi:MAG: DNA gyrase inhibitor YacG [Cognatishimia sp.]|uniref:DNA gyrase inhibitor YacG n=1 Tax=Cognatishimia sp. 1_MG-2023 TaxID=3062642 RepID=UPI0026E2C799|nr:DNA gyrase inhibitor YacG [Cognatishimia sp. 1_MG-2023]MDO6726239.1 DNA gyrase inhibitor YacG [Cognatishimia sp. 1_MG-2023]
MSCPICKKETVTKYRPFCSKRCADIDLGKWLNEDYSLEAPEEDVPEAAFFAGQKKDEPLH